ncbi:phospholipase D-like domain-containing protein [Desertibaculum subflavum]|uniref:phospholipase D-like domain-containing protein n=1 Tax=Desertibaculum subflavum TaxID=2268458 RepID=UPI0013C4F6B0
MDPDASTAWFGPLDRRDCRHAAQAGSGGERVRTGGWILSPGNNCWRTAEAREAAVLIDGEAYFANLAAALQKAERSILILGWDFDHRIQLEPEKGPTLGEFLRSLVEAKPDLRIRVLIWSLAPVHGPGSMTALLFGARWHRHPRIEVRLDHAHAFYACHHQKIVCIDDCLAFCGGIDLTVGRWDRRRHALPGRRRLWPGGGHYPPVHDVQIGVTGDAAAELSHLARERWRRARGELLDPCPSPVPPPSLGVQPDFTDVRVAIARCGSEATGKACDEIAALTLDSIGAAKRWIYIETQYLTSRLVGDALKRSLAEPSGPEIVIVTTKRSWGLVEHFVMSNNRDRLIRLLRRADRHGRLRCCYPVVPGPKKPHPMKVHSKLMVVDDRLLRVGSANLNNRSMQVDTECDLAIESGSPAEQARIAGIRNSLLAEHLSATPEGVAAVLAQTGSLFAVIDRLNHGPRHLHPFDHVGERGPTKPIPLTWLLDPPRSIGA